MTVGTVGTVEVVEFTDPWCSWAWGTEPKLRKLRWAFEDQLSWRRVMGGLVPNRLEREPDFDAAAVAQQTAGYWAKVTVETGMPWPVRLERTPVSSVEACIAVKAAERQDDSPTTNWPSSAAPTQRRRRTRGSTSRAKAVSTSLNS
jgi:protein-disulfide isomerase-like protein with CxxC motif